MARPFIRAHSTFHVAAAICALWVTSACCQQTAKQPNTSSEVARCRRITNEHIRTRCLEDINLKVAPMSQEQPPVPEKPTASGTWQLARTPNPSGGRDSISITKSINPTASEQSITGLMLRCAEGATTNVLIVLAAPLPLRAHPKVTVVAGASTTEFIASVRPPGTLVLLPEKASALIENTWQSVPELAVSLAEKKSALRGVIPLDNIGDAMQELQSNCPKLFPGRR